MRPARAAWLLLFALIGCGGPAPNDEPSADSHPAAPKPSTDAPAIVAATEAGAESGAKPSRPAVAEKDLAATTANVPAVPAIDEQIRRPATIDEAATVLDLATFPLLPGAKEPGMRLIASLSYEAVADVKSAYDFQRRALVERKWKELSDAQIYDQSASGQFGKDGYHVSVSVFPSSEPGKVAVRLQNQGNLNLGKLPVPPGTKFQYAFPGVASFQTTAGVEETAAAVRTLLVDQGWQPYGSAGDSLHFKQNAIHLDARVLAPPAQPGKTVIDYSAVLMSAELPAPPAAENVQYAESNKQLNLDASGSPADVARYYETALAPAGWQATTENPVTDRYDSFMIFRNPGKDMLTLNMRDLREDKKTRVSLRHQSAAEVAELDRQVTLAIEERKRKAEEERNRPKPKATIALPDGAQDVRVTKAEIEFHLPNGKGQAAAQTIARQLTSAGWKAEDPAGNDMAGQLSLKKNEQRITILYVDPGFIPAQITVSSFDVELE